MRTQNLDGQTLSNFARKLSRFHALPKNSSLIEGSRTLGLEVNARCSFNGKKGFDRKGFQNDASSFQDQRASKNLELDL
jgi:hypothetical protein